MGNFMLGFEKSCLNNVRCACRYFPVALRKSNIFEVSRMGHK